MRNIKKIKKAKSKTKEETISDHQVNHLEVTLADKKDK